MKSLSFRGAWMCSTNITYIWFSVKQHGLLRNIPYGNMLKYARCSTRIVAVRRKQHLKPKLMWKRECTRDSADAQRDESWFLHRHWLSHCKGQGSPQLQRVTDRPPDILRHEVAHTHQHLSESETARGQPLGKCFVFKIVFNLCVCYIS